MERHLNCMDSDDTKTEHGSAASNWWSGRVSPHNPTISNETNRSYHVESSPD